MKNLRALSSVVSVLLTACAAPSPGLDEPTIERTIASPLTDAASAFAYVRATREPGSCEAGACSYVVTSLTSALPCDETPCRVGSIQMTDGGFSNDETAAILARLSESPEASSMLFVGRISPSAALATRTLHVVEAWISPRPVAATGAFFHASRARECDDGSCSIVETTALADWSKARAWTVENATPWQVVPSCIPRTGIPTTRWHFLAIAEAALKQPTGLLVAGTRVDDGLVAKDYFVKLLAARACDHPHGSTRGIECCGMTATCVGPAPVVGPPASPAEPPPRPVKLPVCADTDHILGGISDTQMQYERETLLGAWLVATNQPLSNNPHNHAVP